MVNTKKSSHTVADTYLHINSDATCNLYIYDSIESRCMSVLVLLAHWVYDSRVDGTGCLDPLVFLPLER